MEKIGLLLAAYLLGSIPVGYLAGKAKGVDIRQHGSGNIGTTNAFRILGPLIGTLVLIGDAGKGVLAVLLAGHFLGDSNWELLTGLMAICGHNWSVFLGFKGGRGVATSAGVVLMLVPEVLAAALVVFGVILVVFGYVSLASMFAAVSVPVLMVAFNEPAAYLVFAVLIALFIIYRHRPNIQRIINGTEPKVRLRGKH